MKRNHMKLLVAKLIRLYPKAFPANMDAMELAARVDDYMAVLGDQSYKDVDEAINELVKKQTFMPSVAEIREAVRNINKTANMDRVDEFTDEDGYKYRRINGVLEVVERPRREA